MQLERGPGPIVFRPRRGVDLQFSYVAKGTNTGQRTSRVDLRNRTLAKDENAGVMNGRSGRIWEEFHPLFDRYRVKLDASKKVTPGPRDQRLGDEATCLEGSRLGV